MDTNIKTKTEQLTLTAAFAALACVATMVIQVPSPTNGYVNMGDAVVLLAAFTLGPWYGAAAAGIGSALADLLTGYAHYVPGTLVIKAAMALVAGLIGCYAYRKNEKFTKKLPIYMIAGVAAEIIMVVGYYIYAGLLLGKGLAAALSSIPSNIVQGVFGIAAAILLFSGLVAVPAYNRVQGLFLKKN